MRDKHRSKGLCATSEVSACLERNASAFRPESSPNPLRDAAGLMTRRLTKETAWCVTMQATVLVLAAALGTLAGAKAFLFFLFQLWSQPTGVFSLMGSGALLFVTIANVTTVFTLALSWLWSFRTRSSVTRST